MSNNKAAQDDFLKDKFLKKSIEELKATRKTIHKHITLQELPQAQQFDRLSTQSKYFIDTIKE